jgi:hypothetical protein
VSIVEGGLFRLLDPNQECLSAAVRRLFVVIVATAAADIENA